MFEFSLASIVLVAVIGAVAWHFYATKILGYVHPAEAALRADWAGFKAELVGLHNVSHQAISSLQSIVHPLAGAAITAAAAPPNPAPADPAKVNPWGA